MLTLLRRRRRRRQRDNKKERIFTFLCHAMQFLQKAEEEKTCDTLTSIESFLIWFSFYSFLFYRFLYQIGRKSIKALEKCEKNEKQTHTHTLLHISFKSHNSQVCFELMICQIIFLHTQTLTRIWFGHVKIESERWNKHLMNFVVWKMEWKRFVRQSVGRSTQ